jgi:hypothetical protein
LRSALPELNSRAVSPRHGSAAVELGNSRVAAGRGNRRLIRVSRES